MTNAHGNLRKDDGCHDQERATQRTGRTGQERTRTEHRKDITRAGNDIAYKDNARACLDRPGMAHKTWGHDRQGDARKVRIPETCKDRSDRAGHLQYMTCTWQDRNGACQDIPTTGHGARQCTDYGNTTMQTMPGQGMT